MPDWAIDPSWAPALFTRTEAQAVLRKVNAFGATDGAMVDFYSAAVVPVIDDIVGATSIRACTQVIYPRVDLSGVARIQLERTPVVAVQSITAQQAGVFVPDVAADVVDGPNGIVAMSNYVPFYGQLVIGYTAGYAVVPPNIKLAALEEFRFLWQVGQQGMRPGFGTDTNEDIVYTPSGYAVPRRVMELLGPHDKPAGIA